MGLNAWSSRPLGAGVRGASSGVGRLSALVFTIALMTSLLGAFPQAASAAEQYNARVDAGSNPWASHSFTADADGTLQASLSWGNDADLTLYLKDESTNETVALARSSDNPEQLSKSVNAGEEYKLLVKAESGSADYSLDVDVAGAGSFVGRVNATSNPYASHFFTAGSDGTIQATLSWASDADLTLYLKDPSGTTVTAGRGSLNPHVLSWQAQAGEQFKLLVKAESGAADYQLDVELAGEGQFIGDLDASSQGDKYRSHLFTASQDGVLQTTIDWEDADGQDITLYLTPQGGTPVTAGRGQTKPHQASIEISAGETYKLVVKAEQGATRYVLNTQVAEAGQFIGDVDATTGKDTYRPHDLAIIEAGELTATLGWDASNSSNDADLSLFLKNPRRHHRRRCQDADQPRAADLLRHPWELAPARQGRDRLRRLHAGDHHRRVYRREHRSDVGGDRGPDGYRGRNRRRADRRERRGRRRPLLQRVGCAGLRLIHRQR